MGDAYCGPSNPLQNFQKHTSADRSLQQDRLAQRRQNAPQGFRSNPYLAGNGPSAVDQLMNQEQGWAGPEPLGPAMATPEFHRPPHAQHAPAAPFGGPAFSEASASPSWARDFQSLSLGPRVERGGSPWKDQFQQHRQASPLAQAPLAAQPAFQQRYNAFSGMPSYQMPMAQSAFQAPMEQSVQDKGKGKVADQFDEAAFARAFEQAAADALEKEEVQAESSTQFQRLPEEEEVAARQTAGEEAEVETMQTHNAAEDWTTAYRRHLAEELEQETLLAQTQLDERLQEDRAVQDAGGQLDRDEDLANTARDLLEKVAHDQDTKFQNSEFLSLMRRFRDGEATIRHGQMQDRLESDASPASRIPHSEQDHDSGRDVRMTGALPSLLSPQPAQGPTTGRWSLADASARGNWREQFGRHPVDDF